MSEYRDTSGALIFDNKRDNPLYRIKKDIVEIKVMLKQLQEDIRFIKEKING